MLGIVGIARRPALVVTLVLLATILALFPARHLRVRSDLVTLLPEGSPAAGDYGIFIERFGGLEKVFVLVSSDPAGEASRADLAYATNLLEEILTASPEVAHARAGLEQLDEKLFLDYVAPRAPLLIGGDWRDAVLRRIEPVAMRERVARLAAALSTPAGIAEGTLARSDPLGFSEELASFSLPAGIPLDVLSSTFLAQGGDTALLILTPARPEMDPAGGRALLAELEAAYDEVQARLGIVLEFHAVGGPLYAAQDEMLLRRDLQRTLAGSVAGTTGILILAFEGLWIPLAALAPVAVALLWTAACMGLLHAEITAVSIGFAAVLVGLGLDYGIHAGARFRQCFLATPDTVAALELTVRRAGPGILASALTTAAGFATLGLAHFRPLKEVGEIVTVGILSILVVTILMGSAVLALAAPRLRRPGLCWVFLGKVTDRLTAFSTNFPKLILAAATCISGLALWGLGNLSLDPDLRTLRPIDHPALEAERLLADRFDLGLDTTTVIVHGRDLPQALARAARAGRLLRRALGPQADISNPADYLAPGEPVRLQQLAGLPLERAAEELEHDLRLANLDPRAFARGLEALRSLGRGEDPGVPPPEAWPDWLADSLSTGDEGAWVALRLRLPAGSWPQGPPPELVTQVRKTVPDSAFASAVAIGAELRLLATRDLRVLGLLALAAVALVAVISFRGRLHLSLLAGLPVILASLWTLGLWSALGRSLDLFSLAALPIMLGIGIDDGLHVMHGALRDPAAGIRGAVRSAGHALVLTTLTTCVGFGSLTLSRIPALRSGGLLIAASVLASLLATMLVLPALEVATKGRSTA